MKRVFSLLIFIAVVAAIPSQAVYADAGIQTNPVRQARIIIGSPTDPTKPTAADPGPNLTFTPKDLFPVIQMDRPALGQVVDGWEIVGDGIQYREYTLPDPNRVYVARMVRANQNAFLESAVGSGELSSERETVSGMAARYNEALNAWPTGWGGRNHVVVAINGDYFNPGSGYPENGQIQSGWYTKRYNDYEGWSGFAWTGDRQAFIGACIVNPPEGQYIVFADQSQRQRINGINAPRQDGQLFLYTPQYAATTQTGGPGAEVVVQLERPLTATPPGAGVPGRVIAIHVDQGATPIPFDAVVLSANGQAAADLLARVHEGDLIGISQEILSVGYDCKTPIPGDWTQVYAGVGGAFTFLKDGQPQHDEAIGAVVPNPRTAIVLNDEYIYFIVVDGRQPGVSVGMSFDALAVFARDTLGATWGIAQDGGGSSTMVINGKVVNTPSDLCKVSGTTDQDLANPNGQNNSAAQGHCERPVANGMLMVANEPLVKSQAFQVGTGVAAPAGAKLYQGPGTNYGVAGSVPGGAAGQVVDDGHGLAGVEAKGAYWWKVDFGGQVGWVMETDLAAIGG